MQIANAARWTADALGRPFESWQIANDHLIVKIAKGIIMVLGKLLSLPFQALADALNDHNYTLVEGEAEVASIGEKISVATWNVLNFPSLIVEGENRPSGEQRFEKMSEALNDLDGVAYLGFQEAHTRIFEEKIVESQSSRFKKFQINNNLQLLGFGSGLMSCDCLPKNTEYEVYELNDHRGGDNWVKKSYTVARVPGKMTIINTHLQSGESNDKDEGGLTNAEVRQSQVKQIVNWARDHGEKVNILLGDLNVPRNRFVEDDETTQLVEGFYKEYENSWLNPKHGYVIDGFATDDERRRFTQADLNKDGSIASKEAVDYIVAIIGKDQKAHCTLKTTQHTSFEGRNDPSDHALLVGDITFV